MANILDFLPLFRENVNTVRARMDRDVNAGLSPLDPNYIDTIEGSFYWDVTQPVVLECSRLWDALATEVPAVAFPAFAFGQYLDEHGVTIDVDRNAPVAATVTVQFTGTPGVLLGAGVRVSTVQTDPDVPAQEFQTIESAVIPPSGIVLISARAAVAGEAGNVPSATITQLLSGIGDITAVTNPSPGSGGADVESDQDYQERLLLEYAQTQGSGTKADYERWSRGYPPVGFAAAFPLFAGTGTVRVVITDHDNNPSSQVDVDGLQEILDPRNMVTTLDGDQTLPAATITVVSTAGARLGDAGENRVLIGGSQMVRYTGLTPTTFTGCTEGSGSFTDGTPVVQGATGAGLAPIGAFVEVATPGVAIVPVAAAITPAEGFSLDGDGGTRAIRADIEAAIAKYINDLPPGGDVILSTVIARIVNTLGVYDVGSVTLNGLGANAAIGDLEIAQAGLITLT